MKNTTQVMYTMMQNPEKEWTTKEIREFTNLKEMQVIKALYFLRGIDFLKRTRLEGWRENNLPRKRAYYKLFPCKFKIIKDLLRKDGCKI